MKTSKFEEVFQNRKPVIGMLTAETCVEQLSVADGYSVLVCHKWAANVSKNSIKDIDRIISVR